MPFNWLKYVSNSTDHYLTKYDGQRPQITYQIKCKKEIFHFVLHMLQDKLEYKLSELTLLNFSPSWCGNSDRKLWKPAFMLCIRRRSLLFAISRRIRFSFSIFNIPPPSSFNLKIRKLKWTFFLRTISITKFFVYILCIQ